MNERIRELIIQTDEWLENNAQSNRYEREIKFAELIVAECMKLNSKELSITAIERLLPLYAEHFGVTE